MIYLMIVLILLLLFLAFTYFSFRMAFYSPQGDQNDDHALNFSDLTPEMKTGILASIDRLLAVPYEKVSIQSDDGLTLNGRYYPSSRTDVPFIMLLHGYRGTPVRDLSYAANRYLAQGYPVLMMEERAHISSEGHVITMGVREQYDCLAWTKYVSDLVGKDRPILLCGDSMGAATVLLASSLDLPTNVIGIVADAPYSSAEAILKHFCTKHYHSAALYPFLKFGARLYGHFRVEDADVIAHVKQAKVPLLIIHGEKDLIVPFEMGVELAKANPQMTEFHAFPNAGHVMSFVVDEPRYLKITEAFEAKVRSLSGL
ncbi:MAG: alpha/beta hydrolase [Lachnospiraceae bacterium]|nr:alpha/beta hydrolase [Lachnospiraceae bacterium]